MPEITLDNTTSCCSSHNTSKWWQSKLFVLAIIYLFVFAFSPLASVLQPLGNSLWLYVSTIAVPVLVGLIMGGVIDWAVPGEYVSKLLAQKKKRTIPIAVLLGFLMTACSHGILAISMQLYKKGASPSAVVAFLLASPWANLPLTIIMFGFFGIKAAFIILSAIVIAIITGYVFMFFEKKELIEINRNTINVDDGFSIRSDMALRLKAADVSLHGFRRGTAAIWAGSISLANMVLWWIMLGAFISAVVAAYLPAHLMHQYMGPTILGLLVTLALATVIEICSEGSAPLAFEIFRQTGALGNSFVFLMAGVVTDYTEIGLIWSNIGWKTAILLPIVTVPQVILFGFFANIFIK